MFYFILILFFVGIITRVFTPLESAHHEQKNQKERLVRLECHVMNIFMAVADGMMNGIMII